MEVVEMKTHYTDEKNTQIVLGLLKAHGIRKVVASPGATNIRLVASMQQDEWFEMYSSVDERSAAYIACGLAAQSGEPVVLSCTGATASRNYMPGLTEAFYRKLPVLAITSTQHTGRVGQNVAQVLDRTVQPKDIVKLSVQLPTCHTEEDEWACNVHANRAMLELRRNGGGPVHINLETTYSMNYTITVLPEVHPIYRIEYKDEMPSLPQGRIGIFVGAHRKWTEELTSVVDRFCELYNAVVLCDQTSNYRGKFRVLCNLVTYQQEYNAPCNNLDLLIHIGEVSGAYPYLKSKAEWRVHPDGEIRDTFKHLKYVFEMEELEFFKRYDRQKIENQGDSYLYSWKEADREIRSQLKELPFSNLWIAQHTASKLPADSILHLGILNSLRSWNFFETPESVNVSCNTGGFGIDGIVSSAIGAALGSPEKTVFCVLGDLAFFYDMNSIGNRHVGKNLRILLINNGRGTEFRNYDHYGAQFGDDADAFIAAAGHYGAKSKDLVRHYASDLGFTYLSASSKEEYLEKLPIFLSDKDAERPIVFEAFTDSEDESNALKLLRRIKYPESSKRKDSVKGVVKSLVGENGYNVIKKIAGKK